MLARALRVRDCRSWNGWARARFHATAVGLSLPSWRGVGWLRRLGAPGLFAFLVVCVAATVPMFLCAC
jgi:hypothetical protein